MRKKSVLLVSVGLALLVGLLGVAAMAQEGDTPPAPPTPTPAGPEVESEVGSLPPAQPGQPLAPTPTPRPPEPEVKDGETGSASALQPVNPPPPPTPTPVPPSATPVPLTLTTTEATPEVPSIPPQPTPENPIGGGTVESGPFTFTLLLYQDDTLSPTTDVGPWAYSDLPGVGWYIGWVYHDPSLQGPISELWGTQPDVEPRVGRDKLQEGDHGGRAGGGVLLPGTSQVGDSVRLVTKVQTPHGSYGAALRFVLRQGTDGFEPTNISVEALPSQ